MKKNIALLPGDGVGPEVTAEAVKVLNKIAGKYNHEFIFTEGLIGGVKFIHFQRNRRCLKSDAILFGAIEGQNLTTIPKYGQNKVFKNEKNCFTICKCTTNLRMNRY
jgi:3-isopropylmalate dehydrogenase